MGLFSRKASSDKRNEGNAKQSNGSASSPSTKPVANGTAPVRLPASKPDAPDVPLPKAPDPAVDPAAYLRSIYAVRERSKLVFDNARTDRLKHFTVDMSKFDDTASYVVSIIKVSALNPTTHCPHRANRRLERRH